MSDAERFAELVADVRAQRAGTLLDEYAASHTAFGNDIPFIVEDVADPARVNTSEIHLDFVIGSPDIEVDGITRGGERIRVLRDRRWQL